MWQSERLPGFSVWVKDARTCVLGVMLGRSSAVVVAERAPAAGAPEGDAVPHCLVAGLHLNLEVTLFLNGWTGAPCCKVQPAGSYRRCTSRLVCAVCKNSF